MGCDCGGGAGTANQAAAVNTMTGRWTIRLHNGTKIGSYPTEELARIDLRRTYNGAGTVVPR